MGVITRTLGSNHMDVFFKGAPETIARLCIPETGILPAFLPACLPVCLDV